MFKQIFLYSLLVGLIAIVCKVLWVLDLNKRVYNHRPGKCQIVKGPVHGSEDIEYLPSEGLAFITSGIFYMENHPDATGKMFLYNFNDPAAKYSVKELEIKNRPANFFPHGLSSWVENGKITLYVVSHSRPDFKHSIEVFDYNREKQFLTHVKTIRHAAFIRPNDLFVVGKDRFIVTNDGSAQTKYANVVELLMTLSVGSVAYYDGKDAHWLVETDKSPNGIWVDLKKKILFYASPNGEFIKVLQLAQDFKSAKLISTVNLLTSPDNLFMDADGVLWTAGHPVLHALTDIGGACQANPKPPVMPAPSQVLRIRFSPDYKTHEVTEPYTDDGRQLSCSSVAVPDGKGNMLIGSVAASLLHCEYSPETV